MVSPLELDVLGRGDGESELRGGRRGGGEEGEAARGVFGSVDCVDSRWSSIATLVANLGIYGRNGEGKDKTD